MTAPGKRAARSRILCRAIIAGHSFSGLALRTPEDNPLKQPGFQVPLCSSYLSIIEFCIKDQRVIDRRVFQRCLHYFVRNVALFVTMCRICRKYKLNEILEEWQMCRNNSGQLFKTSHDLN